MEDVPGSPLWLRIQRGIEADVSSGLLQPGARLPAEPELAARFGAHRHTVRRAISELTQKGLVRVEQGRGSFVNEQVIDYAVGRRTRVEENLLRHHRSFNGTLLSAREAIAEADAVKALKLRGKAPRVVVVEVLNEADGVPLSVVRHVLPASRFTAFPAAYTASGGSVTAALAACGVPDFSRSFTRVSTRLANEAEAKLLKLPKSMPVLVTESVEVDPTTTPVKYGVARFAGDRVNLFIES